MQMSWLFSAGTLLVLRQAAVHLMFLLPNAQPHVHSTTKLEPTYLVESSRRSKIIGFESALSTYGPPLSLPLLLLVDHGYSNDSSASHTARGLTHHSILDTDLRGV